MKHKLSGNHPQKRAFITGAGSGLGREFCYELAADGWLIGLADIQLDAAQETAIEVERRGGKAFVFQLDVADKMQYKSVAEDFLQKAGGIDILFNNAGVGDGGLFEEYSLENWEWMIGINQMGVIYGCHYFIPAMKQQKSGYIINTASCAAIACAPGMASYNTTKAAVVAISETLYTELMDYNIGVTVIQPWFFKTNIAQYARGGDEVKIQTKKMMDESKISANEVALQVLQKAGNKKLYAIITAEAQRMWWMKRLAPTWFFKQLKKTVTKQLGAIIKQETKIQETA